MATIPKKEFKRNLRKSSKNFNLIKNVLRKTESDLVKKPTINTKNNPRNSKLGGLSFNPKHLHERIYFEKYSSSIDF